VSVERRGRWCSAEKEQLVGASLEPSASVSSIARESGIHASQLYGWRDLDLWAYQGGRPPDPRAPLTSRGRRLCGRAHGSDLDVMELQHNAGFIRPKPFGSRLFNRNRD
jgi:transposase-like protein